LPGVAAPSRLPGVAAPSRLRSLSVAVSGDVREWSAYLNAALPPRRRGEGKGSGHDLAKGCVSNAARIDRAPLLVTLDSMLHGQTAIKHKVKETYKKSLAGYRRQKRGQRVARKGGVRAHHTHTTRRTETTPPHPDLTGRRGRPEEEGLA